MVRRQVIVANNEQLNLEVQEKEMEKLEVKEALAFIESLTPAGKEILHQLIGAAEFFDKAGMLRKLA